MKLYLLCEPIGFVLPQIVVELKDAELGSHTHSIELTQDLPQSKALVMGTLSAARKGNMSEVDSVTLKKGEIISWYLKN
ncbi:hypothetical protein J437_LFUL003937 [Ladona fulva]|uniref:Uncharacterized protein n=1 Tax=Ladona fulva TaxID=123851 RepID=A0A8K0K9G4_LADFU|nr:hypothetical protein J437_LFUL003937 [Ladona fulva]